ncbi:MAG: hypothetical protein LW808_000665 [Verrucomicrobiota bacterium]|nr:MAG: hypothetical protein LW808_000665 [Verrucomicrobiota bacterium]
MVMTKGRYFVLGLFPLAVSASLLWNHNTAVAANAPVATASAPGALPPGGAGYPAPADPYPLEPDDDIVNQLVLTNAEPRDVIGVLEKLTGRTALVEKLPTSIGKISIDIQEPITRLEAISAVESVLSLNGIAIVDMGEKFLKAVDSKRAISQSPEIVDDSLQIYEPNQHICSKFFKLNYLDANEFNRLVKPILTPSVSNVVVFTASNSLFITDTMANLRRVENLVERTDTPIKMIEEIKFIPLNNVKASSVVKKFDQLKRGALKKYLSNMTIDCDDSSNQLIIITPPANLSIIENIAKQLDNKCELLLRSEVMRIKHGDAKKITEIVSKIVKEQRSRIEKENKMAFERQQAQMTAQGALANALAQAASGSRSNQQISNSYSEFISSQQVPGEIGEEQTAQFSANLTLEADERSNSIIVYGTASDLQQIRNLINNLDVLLDQVRIEVIVAQVTYTEGQQSGLDSFGVDFNRVNGTKNGGTTTAKTGSTSGSAGSTSDDGTGTGAVAGTIAAGAKTLHEINFNLAHANKGTFTGSLRNFSLDAVFKVAQSDTNVKILSTPTLVTTHNRKANFKIGEKRPFLDSSTKSDSKDAQERIQIKYENVGLELKVTPLIGNNGIIQMEIEQRISQKTENAKIASLECPVITDKEINSFVSVANGDVIVLAGFKERKTDTMRGKLFLIGDIPLIGDLLSPRKREELTTELIIFIKPTIILRPQDEAAYLDQQVARTSIKEDIDYYKKTGGDLLPSKPFPHTTLEDPTKGFFPEKESPQGPGSHRQPHKGVPETEPIIEETLPVIEQPSQKANPPQEKQNSKKTRRQRRHAASNTREKSKKTSRDSSKSKTNQHSRRGRHHEESANKGKTVSKSPAESERGADNSRKRSRGRRSEHVHSQSKVQTSTQKKLDAGMSKARGRRSNRRAQ